MAPGRRWLVDGNNLMGSVPDGWWKDPQAASLRLARRLATFAESSAEEVTVVFDGNEPSDPSPWPASVRTLWSGRQSADDVIAKIANEDPAPSSLVLVSSDRGLVKRVEDAGTAWEGVAAFRSRMNEAESPR